MQTIHFYFDFISSNAYLAWTQLEKLTGSYSVQIIPVPVLFAALLQANDNVGPAEIPAKRQWMLKNTLRKAALLDVPLNPPRHHPFNPLLALRACSLPMQADQRVRLIDGLFKAVWVEGRHVSEAQELAVIAGKAGLDGAKLVADVEAGLGSAALRRQTGQALEKGVFGVPSLLIDQELFFGYDDFVFIESYLQGKGLLDPATLQAWDIITPSASRSRI